MQNKIITQITYKLKRQTKESYTFVYLVIFYEVDKNCFYSEALIMCVRRRVECIIILNTETCCSQTLKKNYLRLPYSLQSL